MAREFIWDGDLQRFRITKGSEKGQYIERDELTRIEEIAIQKAENLVMKHTRDYRDDKITLKEWQELVVLELRDLHLQSFALGNGGWGNLTDVDYESIRAGLDQELEFFEQFSKEIPNLSPEQIQARVRMYLNKFHSLTEAGRLESHIKAGYKYESRHTTITDSCESCLAYEQAGVVDIGELPNPGEICFCLSNCRCYKKFYKIKTESALNLLNQLGNKSLVIKFG